MSVLHILADEYYSILHMDHISNHQLGHLCYFYFLGIVNIATMNTTEKYLQKNVECLGI